MKHNKLFGMLAVSAVLAISACSGGGSSSKHTHYAAPDAPWQHDNNNHWKDCAENDKGKVDNAKHTFGEPFDVVPATCTAAGSQKVKCTVCDAVVEQTIPMKDHNYGEWEVTAEPDCTNAGSRKRVCQDCQHEDVEEIPANGHSFGEWEFIKEPNCTEGGSRKRTCSVCNYVETEELKALGHDIHLVDDQGEPEAGKAKVRLYDCSRCDVTYLGFKATEVTPASKERLVFETVTTGEKEEQGARFFGHPIGNDCELDPTTGDPSEGVDAVYSKEQTGDYFEYKFDLTDEQVSVLSGDEGACLLYCDAQPAQWMSNNNMDFFAKGTETDWTKAYYIDDDPSHYNEDGSAKEIAGWRYVLYVDGQYQDFDADVATNPMKNNDRGEFVMPYLFKLHKGENSISLRMAAGYRCTFFNFTFRPYEKPTQITVNQENIELTVGEEAQITSTFTELKYQSANAQVASVDATGKVTALKAGETTITVSKEGNFKPAKVPVKVNEKAGVYQVEVEKGTSSKGEDGADQITFREASGGHNSTNAFPKDAVLTLSFDVAEAGTYSMKINARKDRNAPSEFDGKFTSAFEMKLNDNAIAADATAGSSWADVLIGNVELKAGNNTMTFKALTESNPINLDYVRFEKGEPVPVHVHDFSTETPVAAKGEGYVGYTTAVCAEDNAKQIKIAALDGTFATGSSNKSGTREGYLKLNDNNQSISYKFDYQGEAATAKIYQFGFMDNWSSNTGCTYTTKKSSQTLGPSGCNFGINFNNSEVEITDATKALTYGEMLENATVDAGSGNSKAGACYVGEVSLVNGDNTFSFTRYASYNLAVSYFLIVIE